MVEKVETIDQLEKSVAARNNLFKSLLDFLGAALF